MAQVCKVSKKKISIVMDKDVFEEFREFCEANSRAGLSSHGSKGDILRRAQKSPELRAKHFWMVLQ